MSLFPMRRTCHLPALPRLLVRMPPLSVPWTHVALNAVLSCRTSAARRGSWLRIAAAGITITAAAACAVAVAGRGSAEGGHGGAGSQLAFWEARASAAARGVRQGGSLSQGQTWDEGSWDRQCKRDNPPLIRLVLPRCRSRCTPWSCANSQLSRLQPLVTCIACSP